MSLFCSSFDLQCLSEISQINGKFVAHPGMILYEKNVKKKF